MSFDTLSLAGKTALVTGSGRKNGIGAAIAKAFARNGASVAIHYVSETSREKAHRVATDISNEFGTKVVVVHGRLTDLEGAKSIVQQTLKGLEVDHIDILVNNAGGSSSTQNLLEVGKEQMDYDFGVNVFGVIYMTQAVVGAGKMPNGGRIINVGSIASKTSYTATGLYNAAKSAQDSLTAGLAGELGRTHGITVNSLAPGPIPTDASKPYLMNPDGTPNQTGMDTAKLSRAADRLGTVEDMADAALLLVSEKSRWITAQWISISGGATVST
ncbi:putative short-chain dehydrogenase reductase SDR [Rosellinia necatrix]|uniref:Putative short-chain dehydrogenase reductase SDR n=1 Tax=Rosellinia necatrix TaxID=77044 RepID=A0A1S8A7J4_ROSNE|nr:putative short-chain dehydrogenase reductase SDR [Rosellinia necatrix]